VQPKDERCGSVTLHEVKGTMLGDAPFAALRVTRRSVERAFAGHTSQHECQDVALLSLSAVMPRIALVVPQRRRRQLPMGD
jgi:hypothetical protein